MNNSINCRGEFVKRKFHGLGAKSDAGDVPFVASDFVLCLRFADLSGESRDLSESDKIIELLACSKLFGYLLF